jgi:hypothetical protein
MPTITDILTGLPGAGGCDFRSSTGELFYVEFSGNFSKTNPLAPAHTVIGAGYANPEDIELSADGVHAYITERSGNLVKASLSTPNRASATVIASGMVAHNRWRSMKRTIPPTLWNSPHPEISTRSA